MSTLSARRSFLASIDAELALLAHELAEAQASGDELWARTVAWSQRALRAERRAQRTQLRVEVLAATARKAVRT